MIVASRRLRRDATLQIIEYEGETMVTKIWDNPAVSSIQVDLPQNPLRFLNVYVIVAPEQKLLIDTVH